MPSGDFSSESTSANAFDTPPDFSTTSQASSTFAAATQFGVVNTVAVSRSDFESDSGDLANGRYRR